VLFLHIIHCTLTIFLHYFFLSPYPFKKFSEFPEAGFKQDVETWGLTFFKPCSVSSVLDSFTGRWLWLNPEKKSQTLIWREEMGLLSPATVNRVMPHASFKSFYSLTQTCSFCRAPSGRAHLICSVYGCIFTAVFYSITRFHLLFVLPEFLKYVKYIGTFSSI
jgi:hypothetical protein